MNIWDPIWKEDKEDNISEPLYKMKPVQINLNDISFNKSVRPGGMLLWEKFYLDIEFNEDYINTLDVDKRKMWILDDGGCIVGCTIHSTGLEAKYEDEINDLMKQKTQRKWIVSKITNGVRLTVDMPRYVMHPKVTGRITGHLSYTWDFGSVKVLIPEPIRFDSSVVTISATFAYSYTVSYKYNANPYNLVDTAITSYMHVSNVNNYQVLPNLQLIKPALVAVHKFTIESAKNLVNELKEVISVPFPISQNYILEDHPEYPITYAKSRGNQSIGSSSKPKEKCHTKLSPTTLIDQTQLKGRSLRKLGIVAKILSIIKRRKREIK